MAINLCILCNQYNEGKSIGSIFLDKTIAAQVHGSNFVSFDFHENDDLFCKSLES